MRVRRHERQDSSFGSRPAGLLWVLCLLMTLAASACAVNTAPFGQQASQRSPEPIGLANPSAVACIRAGGEYRIISQADGAQSGQCRLPDGQVCDAWAWYRRECGAEKTAPSGVKRP